MVRGCRWQVQWRCQLNINFWQEHILLVLWNIGFLPEGDIQGSHFQGYLQSFKVMNVTSAFQTPQNFLPNLLKSIHLKGYVFWLVWCFSEQEGLQCKPDCMSLIPKTHSWRTETTLNAIVWLPHMYYTSRPQSHIHITHTYIRTHKHTQIIT